MCPDVRRRSRTFRHVASDAQSIAHRSVGRGRSSDQRLGMSLTKNRPEGGAIMQMMLGREERGRAGGGGIRHVSVSSRGWRLRATLTLTLGKHGACHVSMSLPKEEKRLFAGQTTLGPNMGGWKGRVWSANARRRVGSVGGRDGGLLQSLCRCDAGLSQSRQYSAVRLFEGDKRCHEPPASSPVIPPSVVFFEVC